MKDVVVIPTYNEKENIGILIPLIFKMMPEIRIVVADDSSPDGTADVVLNLKKQYKNLSLISRSEKNGLGQAYINAFTEVLKDQDVGSVIMMDADLSHGPQYLPEMIRKSQKFSVVVGSRYVKSGGTVGWELWRRVLSSCGNFYCRTITSLPVYDCTGGFNVISAELLRRINFSKMDMSGYAFIMELKYLLYKAGGTFYEVPITFVNRAHGETKISGHIISEGVLAPLKMRFASGHDNKEDVIGVICPLCGSARGLFFAEKRGYSLYKCQKCRLLFLSPLPKSVDVYDDKYFSGAEHGYGYVDYDADKEPMIPTFEKYLDIVKKLGFSNGNLLDIGCATGFFMNLAKNRGFAVSGVEISDFAAGKGRKEGLDIKTGDIFSPEYKSEYFDVITMFDVIEHVPDPKSTILEAHRILKKGGLLIINTPDAESLWARVLGSHWQLIMPPEHIHYFSPNNLSEYLEKNGFEVKLNTKIGKSFTLQYIFKMLYKLNGSKIFLTNIFSKGFMSRVHIPINLYDNFFLIVQKNEK